MWHHNQQGRVVGSFLTPAPSVLGKLAAMLTVEAEGSMLR